MSNPTRHPLSWPVGWPRTEPGARERARFSGRTTTRHSAGDRTWTSQQSRALTMAEALKRLLPELERLGAEDVLVSTNVPTRSDGLPRSGAREDRDDPGAAVYFRLDGRPTVLACDAWDRPADNLAAIAAHVGALRGIDRWGVGSLEQAFRGYQALPAQASAPGWREVLGCPSTTSLSVAREAYKRRVREAHPDHGGSGEAFAIVQGAWKAAQEELGRA